MVLTPDNFRLNVVVSASKPFLNGTAGFTIFPSFVASGTKIPYVECTKYLRSTLLPFSDYTTHTREPWPKLVDFDTTIS
jgi:hypothetical protein